MKTVLKVLLVIATATAIICSGVWGAFTFTSNTDSGWKVWGLFLVINTIVLPTVIFWRNKLMWLLDLEDLL